MLFINLYNGKYIFFFFEFRISAEGGFRYNKYRILDNDRAIEGVEIELANNRLLFLYPDN